MRTTLTLDDDVCARLQRLRPARGGQKQLINDLLRLGLDQLEQRPTSVEAPFSTSSDRLGARIPSLDNVAEILATSEAEDWR